MTETKSYIAERNIVTSTATLLNVSKVKCGKRFLDASFTHRNLLLRKFSPPLLDNVTIFNAMQITLGMQLNHYILPKLSQGFKPSEIYFKWISLLGINTIQTTDSKEIAGGQFTPPALLWIICLMLHGTRISAVLRVYIKIRVASAECKVLLE